MGTPFLVIVEGRFFELAMIFGVNFKRYAILESTSSKMNQLIRLCPLVLIAFLFGCSEEQISVTKNVPKDYESYAQWSLPEGWTATKTTSNMVLAAFNVQSGDQTLKFTVSTFEGGGGSDLENLNRWLRQLGRPPANDSQLEQLRDKMKLGLHEFLYFDLSKDGPNQGDKFLTAILREGNRSWFFKLAGPTEELLQQAPAFKQFLTSFRLQGDPKEAASPVVSATPPPTPPKTVPPKPDPRFAAALSPTGGGKVYPAGGPLPQGTPPPPPGPPPLPPGGLPAPPTIPPEILEKIKNRNTSIQAPRAVEPVPPVSGPKWTVPAGWEALPPTSMRKGNFVIAGDGDSKAEVTVIPLNVGSGSMEANIGRWAGQVGISADELKANPPKPQEFQILGQSGWYVPIEGKEQAIHMGMVDHAGQTWYFKLKGPKAIVSSQKEAFQTFLKSVQL